MELKNNDIGKFIRFYAKDKNGVEQLNTEVLQGFHTWDSGITTFWSFNGKRQIIGVTSEIVELLHL